jgi:formyltetrahydrofolate-dependent phosphoribosylglycinamide formyltransferase
MMLQFPLSPLRLAVLISGGGTTLRNLIEHIRQEKLDARIVRVISSNPAARGLEFARAAAIETHVVPRLGSETLDDFSRRIFDLCRGSTPHDAVHLVAMGGFLKLVRIPDDFVHRVVNIHPSLIPAFCGRGYYGLRVHQAVLEYGAKYSGCTVHFVDEQYDHGPIILQRVVPVLDDDTPQSLAARVFAAECEAYPEALRLFAAGRLRIEGRRVRILPPAADAPPREQES